MHVKNIFGRLLKLHVVNLPIDLYCSLIQRLQTFSWVSKSTDNTLQLLHCILFSVWPCVPETRTVLVFRAYPMGLFNFTENTVFCLRFSFSDCPPLPPLENAVTQLSQWNQHQGSGTHALQWPPQSQSHMVTFPIIRPPNELPHTQYESSPCGPPPSDNPLHCTPPSATAAPFLTFEVWSPYYLLISFSGWHPQPLLY